MINRFNAIILALFLALAPSFAQQSLYSQGGGAGPDTTGHDSIVTYIPETPEDSANTSPNKPIVLAQVPMTGAGLGSPDATAVIPVSTACLNVSGTTTTFSAQGTGGANPNRVSVVEVNWDDSTNAGTAQITAGTIGGISMTRAVRAVSGVSNSNSEIWWVANPTGTTANIVFTSSTAIDGMTIAVYSLIGFSGGPVAVVPGTTSISQAYTNKEVVLAAASRQVNVSTSLSNMTNDFSAACGTHLWGVHASQRLNGTGTLTSTISPTSSTPLIAAAKWSTSTAVIVLPAGTSWTVPSNWTAKSSANNTIVAWGGGGGGAGATSTVAAGGSGGGGAYSSITNFSTTAGSSITYQIGQGGSGGAISTNGGNGTLTTFNTTTLIVNFGFGGVATGVGGNGGQGSTSTPAGNSGGNGTNAASGNGASGGGGAGGPNGAGKASVAASNTVGGGGTGGGAADNGGVGVVNSTTTGGNGGAAQDGTAGGLGGANTVAGSAGAHGSGGGGGGGLANGGAGGPGVGWIQTSDGTVAGPGGGGGGGGASHNGGAGGSCGGGGGGGALNNGSTSGTGGAGANGCIVITYQF